MDGLPNGYAAFATMSDLEASALRPITLAKFASWLDEARRLAGQRPVMPDVCAFHRICAGARLRLVLGCAPYSEY